MARQLFEYDGAGAIRNREGVAVVHLSGENVREIGTRIAACWSACDGLDPAAVAGVVGFLRQMDDEPDDVDDLEGYDLWKGYQAAARAALAALRGGK